MNLVNRETIEISDARHELAVDDIAGGAVPLDECKVESQLVSYHTWNEARESKGMARQDKSLTRKLKSTNSPKGLRGLTVFN